MLFVCSSITRTCHRGFGCLFGHWMVLAFSVPGAGISLAGSERLPTGRQLPTTQPRPVTGRSCNSFIYPDTVNPSNKRASPCGGPLAEWLMFPLYRNGSRNGWVRPPSTGTRPGSADLTTRRQDRETNSPSETPPTPGWVAQVPSTGGICEASPRLEHGANEISKAKAGRAVVPSLRMVAGRRSRVGGLCFFDRFRVRIPRFSPFFPLLFLLYIFAFLILNSHCILYHESAMLFGYILVAVELKWMGAIASGFACSHLRYLWS
ncbi:hypothetical protein EDB81DRAFT_415306 [Dactylonectria macrodidyma]|uniref:Uncharacterized protein n=1 Tax=Dactylonectria macrodidyma TaxID=307937 RepID=A0A9P9F878_9HYPO|nr:hypothetical protein EDB81DRAFT_415306 [Dactylonectria macrodidyma]